MDDQRTLDMEWTNETEGEVIDRGRSGDISNRKEMNFFNQ
jgi:hypothetical protein